MKRDVRVDYIKAIAGILVVLGHILQRSIEFYDPGTTSYFNNVIFSLIYSFNMPLFMLISGYLFYGSTSRHSLHIAFQ